MGGAERGRGVAMRGAQSGRTGRPAEGPVGKNGMERVGGRAAELRIALLGHRSLPN